MKKLYSFVVSAMIGAVSFTANAQDVKFTVLQDLTSQVQNADFSADEAIGGLIRTYAKDMTDDGLGNGGEEMYGMQPVTGWTASAPSDNIKNDPSAVGGDARAAGVFAYWSENDEENPTAQLGGAYFAPQQEKCESVTGGKALGIVGVWGATVQYTQDITLPAGAYAIVVPVTNTAGSDAVSKSLTGFVTADGVEYFSSKKTFAVNQQEKDTIMFELAAETAGKLSVGYAFPGVGSGKAYHLFIDCINLYSVDMTPAKVAQAKEGLLALIKEGEQLGADTSAAQDVYDDPNATVEQVEAAIEKQKELNQESQKDLSEFFITNPHFNLDDAIEDGITTYCYDMEGNEVKHYGMQPLTGWVASNPTTNEAHPKDGYDHNSNCNDGRSSGVFALGSEAFLGSKGDLAPATLSDGTTEGKLLGFISVWSGTSQYMQAVTIPAGKYTFSVSYYNERGTGAVDKNLMGFITDAGDEYLCDVKTFTEKSWQKMQVFFELAEPTSGYFTLGYKAANAGSGSMPHLFIDGINLNYVGEIDFAPSLIALQGAVSTAEGLQHQDMQESLHEQLLAAIEAGNALVKTQSSDAEANKAAAEAINDLLPVVKANVAAYAKLQEFKDGDLTDAIEMYDDMPTVAARLQTLADEVDHALDNLALGTDEINDLMASLVPAIKEEVQKLWDAAIESGAKLDEDLDITPLLSGVAYTFSTSARKGNDCPDKEWAFGSASNFSTQFGCAEVWSQSPFTVTRTMSDMPAGTYTITTRAFYRTAGNQDSYDAYTGGDTTPRAFVFAGNNRTALTNVAELARAEADYAGGTAKLSDDMIVPNNREAAYNIFENDDYAELVEKSVKTVLTETGDLKFGVTADELAGDSWVVWYAFQVEYNAIDAAVLDTELETMIAQADAMADDDIVKVNIKASDNLSEAAGQGRSAIEGELKAKVEAMAAIKEAIAYANETKTLFAQLGTLAETYGDMLTGTDLASDSSSDELYTMIGRAQGDDGFASNEDMKSYFDLIPVEWVKYVLAQDGFATASLDKPLDITPAILNADFANGVNSWTYTAAAEGERMAQNQNGKNKVDNNSGNDIVLESSAEAWNPEAINNGIFGQEIKMALPAGYYTLEADGFAINQKWEEGEEVSGVYLMAQNGLGSQTVNICANEGDGTKAINHFAIDFASDGTSLTTVGVQVYNTSANWFVVDNFVLKYLGTEAPDAVAGVKGGAAGQAAIYTLGGVQVSTMAKGINIVKMADGTVVKVIK